MKKILSWALGIIFFVPGITALFTGSAISGIILILISLFIIPAAVDFISQKSGIALSFKKRLVPIIILFTLLIIQIEREKVEYFTENKDSIMNEIRSNINNDNFQAARILTEEYLVTEDSDLMEMYDLIIQKENEKREGELLAEVLTIPESEYLDNLNIYKELLFINPSNDNYQKKVEYYEQKIENERNALEMQETQKAQAAKRQEGIEAQFSLWDGSHNNLVKYVKENMHDPDSFKHVDTYYLDKNTYLIVTMRFRGKNMFGGMVLNSISAKIDLNGKIIEILN